MAKQAGWKDITVVLLGRNVAGLTNIKYKRKVTKERQYGRGNQAQFILSGNEEISGTITILQDELEALVEAIDTANPTAKITDVSFDIVVNYENDQGVATTDIVRGAQLEEYEKGMTQGDTHMKIEMPFMAVALDESV
ncbi:MAG: hypothetical protein AAFY91_01160 [Bacteroidota bacterium]